MEVKQLEEQKEQQPNVIVERRGFFYFLGKLISFPFIIGWMILKFFFRQSLRFKDFSNERYEHYKKKKPLYNTLSRKVFEDEML